MALVLFVVSPVGDVPLVSVRFSVGDRAEVIELPRCDQVGVFFAELKRIVQGETTQPLETSAVHRQGETTQPL